MPDHEILSRQRETQPAYNPAVSNDRRGLLQQEERERELNRRYFARERLKVIGVLAVLLLILIIAFLRFGKTIPWGAR
jgi:hypothetical protein